MLVHVSVLVHICQHVLYSVSECHLVAKSIESTQAFKNIIRNESSLLNINLPTPRGKLKFTFYSEHKHLIRLGLLEQFKKNARIKVQIVM